ncbi:uncharacterized protein [Cicer arietinum]|uniref:F-box/LRR-repeat protein 2-like n=1 Tax=Cicer arietinum TaxID=3827 RepID=A0A1S2XJ97_CICAR|nr:F-box/LRR-repeat protein 2-like [Cicer arietinum]
MAATESFYLPNECWEHVFNSLNDGDNHHHRRYLQSISAVSKQFLSITSTNQFSLTIHNQTLPFLRNLFQRFTNLTSLDLTRFSGDRDALLSQISLFPLQIKSLNLSNHPTVPSIGLQVFSQKITTLTSLICSNIDSIHKTDISVIAHCFPLLEELDLCLALPKCTGDFVDDFDINAFSIALPKLRKVNLSNSNFINDSSLFHLFKNCEFLEEVVVLNCIHLTHIGIASAMRERPNLKSFSVNFAKEVEGMFIDSLRSLKDLTCLDLSSSHISNQLLKSLANQGLLRLKRLVLNRCSGFGYVGIHYLLSKYCFLQHLDLQLAMFLDDHRVAKLSLFLGNLVSINLSNCRMLTELTLFTLIKKCPFVEEIRMEYTSIGKPGVVKDNSLIDFDVNLQMKSLHLSSNPWLNNETIKTIASFCPNLQFLDISSCWGIYEGIVEVLRKCSKIMHLNLASCLRVNLLGMNFQVPKLEVLSLKMTKIDDETLYVISKSCPWLLHLNLEQCSEITEKGVMQVVENCTQLKEINLQHCCKVAADVDLWMMIVMSRPTLRKIMAPAHFRPRNKKWKPLLDHGCFIC